MVNQDTEKQSQELKQIDAQISASNEEYNRLFDLTQDNPSYSAEIRMVTISRKLKELLARREELCRLLEDK